MVINSKLVYKTKARKSTTFAYEYNESYLYIMCKNTSLVLFILCVDSMGREISTKGEVHMIGRRPLFPL